MLLVVVTGITTGNKPIVKVLKLDIPELLPF